MLARDDFLDEGLLIGVLVLSAEVRLGIVWTLGLEPVIASTVTAVLVVVIEVVVGVIIVESVVNFWLGLGTLCLVEVGLMFWICVIFGTALIPYFPLKSPLE